MGIVHTMDIVYIIGIFYTMDIVCTMGICLHTSISISKLMASEVVSTNGMIFLLSSGCFFTGENDWDFLWFQRNGWKVPSLSDSHARDGSLLDLLVYVGCPQTLDGAAVDLLHVGLVVESHVRHVFGLQRTSTGIKVRKHFFSSFLRSSIGGVACVTVINSSATWAATFHVYKCILLF